MAHTRIKSPNGNGKTFTTQQSLDSAVWSICNILRRSNCAGALQYVPELTWILFLRILDERETQEAEQYKAVGAPFTPSLEPPYRWQDWAAPDGPKRAELQGSTALGTFFSKVHDISSANVDDTHIFPLSQVYEGLLLKMGEKGNDGGQFFTPREIIRAMVQVISPQIGATVYDPCDAKKENLVYPIALDNLVLHGIDQPNLWHGNTLTGGGSYDGLFQNVPAQFEVILTNPPFGGKEGKEAQTSFAYKTGATQVLFLQHVTVDRIPGAAR